ncbi:9938_t:CDS:2, partial [Cetraspora pellucida]
MSLNEQLSSTSSVSTIDIPINKYKKPGAKPKKIWNHFIEGERSSKGHASAICKYCNIQFSRENPYKMEVHIAFECAKDIQSIPAEIKQEWIQIIATRDKNILDYDELILTTNKHKRSEFININKYTDSQINSDVFKTGIFRELCIFALNHWKKMNQCDKSAKELIIQMKKYKEYKPPT